MLLSSVALLFPVACERDSGTATPPRGKPGSEGSPPATAAQHNSTERQPSTDLATPAELDAWLNRSLKGHGLSAAQIEFLRTQLQQLAEQQGSSIAEISIPVVRKAGRYQETYLFALHQALRDDPDSYTDIVLHSTDGKLRSSLIAGHITASLKSESVSALESLYEKCPAGSDREKASSAIAGFLAAREGITTALERLQRFEYPEERRSAVVRVAHTCTKPDEAEMTAIRQAAAREGVSSMVDSILDARTH